VSFAVKIICVAFQLVFIVVSVYFVIDLVRKLLDTPSYTLHSIVGIVKSEWYFVLGETRSAYRISVGKLLG
jgi:hypothetical protein